MKAARRRDDRQNKFAAALKGINLDEEKDPEATTFEDVVRRAEAKLAGKTEEEVALEEIGFAVEVEEE